MNKRNKTVATANGVTIKKVVSRNGRVSYHMMFDFWSSSKGPWRKAASMQADSLVWHQRVKALGIVGNKKVFTNKPEAEKFMSFAILSLSG